MEVKIAELATKVDKDEEKMSDHIEDFKAFQKEVRAHLKNLDEEAKVIHGLAASIEQLAKNVTATNEKIDKLATKQDEMGNKISNLEHAPAKKALLFNESIKNDVWKMIIVGAICFLLGGFLPFPLG